MEAGNGTDSKPIAVKVGRQVVKIYPRPAERGRNARFMLADYTTGKRRWRTFADLKAARAEAVRIASMTTAGDVEGAAMTGDDRRDLLRATESVAPLGIDVPTACGLFAEAARLVGAHYVVAAAREFAKRSPASRERLELGKAADTYFEAKEARGRSTRLLQDLKSRLGRFVHDHPGAAIQDFTTGQVQTWLDGLKRADKKPMSATSRRNFATVLSGFFEHFRRRGILADNPCADVERADERSTDGVDFWTPQEAAKLLEAAGPVVKAAVAVGLFCGLRTAEITRIRWRHVNFEAGHVEVGADVAKTASRRLVPLSPAAVALLKPLKGKPEAPVYGEHPTTLPKRVSEACEAAGVRRVQNGARHSWITYRCALDGDVPRVALEAGNSPAVVHQHYRGLATAEQAKAYFGIQPRGES